MSLEQLAFFLGIGLLATGPLQAADFFWNLGTNGTWGDGTRWGPVGGVPNGVGDTAEISTPTAAGHAGGPIYGVTLDADYTIDALTHIGTTANLLATGRTFTVTGDTDFDGYQITFNTSNYTTNGIFNHDDGLLDLVSSSINGSGSYDKDGGTTNLSNSTINVPGSQSAGTISIFGTTSTFNGGFDNLGGIINLDSDTTLNVLNGNFTNSDTFNVLAGNTNNNFTTTTGNSFINSPTGTVNFNAGGTGNREIQLNVDNQGTFNLFTDTEWEETLGVYTNSGAINAAGEMQLTNSESYTNSGNLTSTGGYLNLNGSGSATSTFDNSGTITIQNGLLLRAFENQTNSGTLDINSGAATIRTTTTNNPYTFTNSGDIDVDPSASLAFAFENNQTGNLILMPGSTLDGGGNISFNQQTVDIQGNWSPDQSPLTLLTSSLNGVGTFSTADDISLTATNSNFNATTSHSGDATFNSTGNTIFGAFTVEPSGSFIVSNGARIRLNDSDFTNHGILLLATGTSSSFFWENDTGSLATFINSPTGTATTQGSGQRRFNCNTDNQGFMSLLANTTEFDNNFGIHSNSGDILATGTFLLETVESYTNSGNLTSTGGYLNLNGSGSATSTFDNSGTITIQNGLLLRLFETMTNSGTIDVNTGTATIRTTTTNNPYTFTNSGTINVASGATAAFTFETNQIGVTTNEASGVLAGSGTISVTNQNFTNHGTIAPGNSTGILTIGQMNHTATSVFDIEVGNNSGPGTGHDQLIVDGNITLNGTLKISRLNNYLPNPSDTYTIISATGELTGNFLSVVDNDPLGEWTVTVDESSDTVSISFVADPVFDYSDFQESYFTAQQILDGDTDPNVDFDGDGLVNFLEWIHGFDPTSTINPAIPLIVERTATTLDLIYPESALLPSNAYDLSVVTDLDLVPAFADIPETDYTRLADTPLAGNPNINMVTIRVTNTSWHNELRFFQLEYTGN